MAETPAVSNVYQPPTNGWNLAKVTGVLSDAVGKTMEVAAYGVSFYSATYSNPVKSLATTWEKTTEILSSSAPSLSQIKQLSEIFFGDSYPTPWYWRTPYNFVQSHPYITAYCLFYVGKTLVQTAEKIFSIDREING